MWWRGAAGVGNGSGGSRRRLVSFERSTVSDAGRKKERSPSWTVERQRARDAGRGMTVEHDTLSRVPTLLVGFVFGDGGGGCLATVVLWRDVVRRQDGTDETLVLDEDVVARDERAVEGAGRHGPPAVSLALNLLHHRLARVRLPAASARARQRPEERAEGDAVEDDGGDDPVGALPAVVRQQPVGKRGEDEHADPRAAHGQARGQGSVAVEVEADDDDGR